MIKCTHHHFLKWAATRAPKVGFVGVEGIPDSSTIEVLVTDMSNWMLLVGIFVVRE
jgi:hypothetical protein